MPGSGWVLTSWLLCNLWIWMLAPLVGTGVSPSTVTYVCVSDTFASWWRRSWRTYVPELSLVWAVSHIASWCRWSGRVCGTLVRPVLVVSGLEVLRARNRACIALCVHVYRLHRRGQL